MELDDGLRWIATFWLAVAFAFSVVQGSRAWRAWFATLLAVGALWALDRVKITEDNRLWLVPLLAVLLIVVFGLLTRGVGSLKQPWRTVFRLPVVWLLPLSDVVTAAGEDEEPGIGVLAVLVMLLAGFALPFLVCRKRVGAALRWKRMVCSVVGGLLFVSGVLVLFARLVEESPLVALAFAAVLAVVADVVLGDLVEGAVEDLRSTPTSRTHRDRTSGTASQAAGRRSCPLVTPGPTTETTAAAGGQARAAMTDPEQDSKVVEGRAPPPDEPEPFGQSGDGAADASCEPHDAQSPHGPRRTGTPQSCAPDVERASAQRFRQPRYLLLLASLIVAAALLRRRNR